MKHLKTHNKKKEITARRVCSDRRQFSYAAYVPERRSNMDRREMPTVQLNAKVMYG